MCRVILVCSACNGSLLLIGVLTSIVLAQGSKMRRRCATCTASFLISPPFSLLCGDSSTTNPPLRRRTMTTTVCAAFSGCGSSLSIWRASAVCPGSSADSKEAIVAGTLERGIEAEAQGARRSPGRSTKTKGIRRRTAHKPPLASTSSRFTSHTSTAASIGYFSSGHLSSRRAAHVGASGSASFAQVRITWPCSASSLATSRAAWLDTVVMRISTRSLRADVTYRHSLIHRRPDHQSRRSHPSSRQPFLALAKTSRFARQDGPLDPGRRAAQTA